MEKERKISIKKMFWYVVRHWSSILLGGIVFAIVFTGVQYRKDYNNARNSAKQVSVADIKASMPDEELKQVIYVQRCKEIMDAASVYLENSIYMKIPYNEILQATQQYVITVDSIEGDISKSTVVAALDNYVTSGALADDVAVKLGDTSQGQYLSEIFSIPDMVDENALVYQNESVSESTFVLNVIHYDTEQLQQIERKVREAIDEYIAQLNTNGIVCNATLISDNIGKKVDISLQEEQRDQTEVYSAVCNKFYNELASLSSNQLRVYYSDETNSELQENVSESASSEIRVSINKKTAILGFAAGILIVICLLMVCYIGTGKVRGEEDYEVLDIPLLGMIQDEKAQKGFLGKIDQWLVKRSGADRRGTEQQWVKKLYSNIYIQCKTAEIDRIYLTGTLMNIPEGLSWIKELQSLLEEKGIKLEAGTDITMDAEALLNASTCGNIILVEQELNSVFSYVVEEKDVCDKSKLNVIGGILIQG